MYCRIISVPLFKLAKALRIAVETMPSMLLMANCRSCVPSLFLAGSATAMAAAWNVTVAPASVTSDILEVFNQPVILAADINLQRTDDFCRRWCKACLKSH
jgi:hypothetical protein